MSKQQQSEEAVMTIEELKRCIEIADRVLWETRHAKSYNWVRDYYWLQGERARLIKLLQLQQNQQ
jgi:hypothetical protein